MSAHTQEREMMQARIRQMYLPAVVALGLVAALAGTAFAQSSNSQVGTWKQNIAKSKYSAGTAVKSGTTTIEAAGTGVKYTIDSADAGGTVRHWTYTANYDGKDNPITGNSQNGDSAAITRVDANTTHTVYKKGGKVSVTMTSVVSSDGKTRTNTSKGTNVLGQTVNNVQVYDKQ
jgi:hypothetical protein